MCHVIICSLKRNIWHIILLAVELCLDDNIRTWFYPKILTCCIICRHLVQHIFCKCEQLFPWSLLKVTKNCPGWWWKQYMERFPRNLSPSLHHKTGLFTKWSTIAERHIVWPTRNMKTVSDIVFVALLLHEIVIMGCKIGIISTVGALVVVTV